MKKIVELLIDWENLEFDDLGVEVMSLVDNPAIGIDFLAFSEQQFVEPKAGESEEEYVGRCIPILIEEGYDQDQAAAICYNSYKAECEDCFDLEDACQEGYIAIGLKPKGGRMVPNCVPVEANMQMESIDDYPEYIKEGAAKGIRLNEEQNNKCGTQVGKVRAQQLAQGKPISEETVRRMYSYLSRAMSFFDGNDETKCGTISIYLWGGPEALEWAEKKVKQLDADRDAATMQAYLQLAQELGETLDYENTIYIDGTQTQFNTISDYLKGIISLDILGKKINKDEVGEIRYRYAGPTAQRPFCQAMLSANKVYTYDELQQMGRATINGIDTGPNALMRWKGGPNCRHYFERVRLYKDGNRTVVVSEGPATENEMNVTMESRRNGGYRMSFSSDEEMIVTGPAMIPQQLILRKDEQGNPFHVYFSKETIKNIARKFFEYNKMNNTDIDHDEKVTTENTLLESWIVEDPEMDKSKSLGYSVPKGSWMVSYKINNQETWQKIKEGKINGFSIAGNFIEVAKKL